MVTVHHLDLKFGRIKHCSWLQQRTAATATVTPTVKTTASVTCPADATATTATTIAAKQPRPSSTPTNTAAMGARIATLQPYLYVFTLVTVLLHLST